MDDIALAVSGISKQYRIGGRREGYRTLRDTLVEACTAPVRQVSRLLRRQPRRPAAADETIWALYDVTFNIKRGEVVGLIGRNGAGKSTLLKILSRITEPTVGFAEIRGRVGSLLEVGAGFHAELTGRENIYLNGSILGMRRTEIDRKFDEIVAFAEVEKFIDTPVKYYSSGMYMRLAFAVAAHLEPEILLIDEVLAVGDAGFQQKCLDKMQRVGQEGCTIVLVSHNMSSITRLCQRAILLHEGKVLEDGPSHRVVGVYLHSGIGRRGIREWRDSAAPGNEIARLRAVRVRTKDNQIVDAVDIRQPVGVEMEYDVHKAGYVMMPNYHFFNEEGLHIFSAHDLDPQWRGRPRPVGRYRSTAWIPGNLLAEGTVLVSFELTTLNPVSDLFRVRNAIAFQVIDSLEGNSARGDWGGHMPGVVRPLLQWDTQFSANRHAASLVQAAEAGL